METSISPKQTLFLWRLLVEPEGAFLQEVKNPSLSATERNQLVSGGLIEVEKRKPKSKSRPCNYAFVTEKGWNWIESHLDAPLPKQGNGGLAVLGRLLQQLKLPIEAGEVSLAGLLAPREPTPVAETPVAETTLSTEAPPVADEFKRRLYAACAQLVGDGVYGQRVRLADLRAQLADVPRPDLDCVLQELERSQAAALYPLNDPREIRPEDEEAALPNSSGADRHVLYLSHPR